MNDLVTVIIPLYNIGEYLKSSIKSVQCQSYEDLEILLIDDGSYDDTLKIANDLAKRDNRIHVIHKENGGVSSARNVGIDNARGKYIAFIDGDDIVAPMYIEQLLAACQGQVLSICMHTRVSSYDISFQENTGSFDVVNARECAKRVLRGTFPISACASLYVKEKIGTSRFPVGIRNNEDKLFLYQYLLKNENGSVAIMNDKMYGYFVREGSATRSVWNGSRDVIQIADKMYAITAEAHPEWIELAQVNRIRARLDTLKAIVRAKGNTAPKEASYKNIKRDTLLFRLPSIANWQLKAEFTALSAGNIFFMTLVKLYYALVKDRFRFERNERITRQE